MCNAFYHGLRISTRVPSINLMHLGNSCNCKPNVTLSFDVGQWISFGSTSLMHDAMKIASSHNFDQFHTKVSCFMYSMKFKRCCEGDNFVNLTKQIEMSLVKLKNTILGFSLNFINIFLTLKQIFRTIIITLSLN